MDVVGWYTDPVRFRQVGTATLFLLGGALFLLGMVATEWEQEDGLGPYLDSLERNPARSQAAALLLHFATACLSGALFGAASIAKARGVGLAHAALVMGVLGATTMAGLLVIDFYDLAIAQTMPRAEGVALEEKVSTYGGLVLMFVPALIGFLVGMTLALLSLWRAGFIPLWVPLVFFIGFGLGEAARGLDVPPLWGAMFTALLGLVAFSHVGVRILHMTRQEWLTGVPEAKTAPPPSPGGHRTSG